MLTVWRALRRLGFEVLCADGTWTSTPVMSKAADSVTVGPAAAACKASAIRYLWYASPCSPFKGQPQVPYKCPVYTDVTPLGSLTGEMDRLPLGPFMLEL